MEINKSSLRSIVRGVLSEAVDPVAKIQSLIDQANDAYNQALAHQGGGDWPLMDRDGECYGLSGDIRLDGRGYVVIPYTGAPYSSIRPVKIRVLTKAGGKIRVIPGDYFDEGWKDVKKYLKQIIRDAQIGNGAHDEYDPAWEDEGNRDALRAMNKKIGRRANAGMEYLESVIRESVRRSLAESWDGYSVEEHDEYFGEDERLRDMEAQCMEELLYFEDGTIIPEGEDSDLIDMEYVPVALYPVFSYDYDDVIDVEFNVEWNYRSDGMQKKLIDDEVQSYIDAHREEIIGRMISRL